MDDLKLLKKYYGEDMMKYCREYLSTLLEKEGLLFSTIDSRFHRDKNLYRNIARYNQKERFAYYIMSIVMPQKNDENIFIDNPYELMKKAGYTLYECQTEEEIQSFKKYYKSEEELCTFRGGRLNSCYVFFAVKDNVDEIKRDIFTQPFREDEYGTSVISIQFSKSTPNRISIKNRYNHTVSNPDATFSNNLENIIPGLTESFKRYYGYEFDCDGISFYLPDYVFGPDKKYYNFNYEKNNIYYCPNNIIINNNSVIKDFYNNSERYILIDYFILDLKEKKLFYYDMLLGEVDSFINSIGTIHKIDIKREDDYKYITLYTLNKEVCLKIDKLNRMVEYTDNYIYHIPSYFLYYNVYLKKINIPNATKIESNFMFYNLGLKELNLESVEEIGDVFLYQNRDLKSINVSNAISIGSVFLENNRSIDEINLPKLEIIKERFMVSNSKIHKINIPSATKIESNFMFNNLSLKEASFPNVLVIENSFLNNNRCLKKIYIPNVTTVGDSFLYSNNSIEQVCFDHLSSVGENFFFLNNSVKIINAPNLKNVGNHFFEHNTVLEDISLPLIKKNSIPFLRKNKRKNTSAFFKRHKVKIKTINS